MKIVKAAFVISVDDREISFEFSRSGKRTTFCTKPEPSNEKELERFSEISLQLGQFLEDLERTA